MKKLCPIEMEARNGKVPVSELCILRTTSRRVAGHVRADVVRESGLLPVPGQGREASRNAGDGESLTQLELFV
jgi:hypothetical protein